MISLTPYISLFITCFVLIAVPGPSILFLLGQAMAVGKRDALFSVVGNAAGTFSVAILMSIGLGYLLASSNWLKMLLPIVGAAVLIFIGIKYLSSSGKPQPENVIDLRTRQTHAFRNGVVVGATNPKAYIIFGTIVPSFVPIEMLVPSVSFLLSLSMVPILTGLVVDALWVLAAAKARSFLRDSTEALKWMHITGGLFMIIMAIWLIVEALGSVSA